MTQDHAPQAAMQRLRATWEELIAPDGAFAVEDSEVLGHPCRTFPGAMPNLRAVWELGSLRGDTPYLVYEDEQYSYADIDQQVRALAHHLRDTYGIGPGDRVAIAMRNYPEWVTSYWATIVLGAAVVGMNAWWTTPEMAYALGDSQPKVLLVDAERLERVSSLLDGLRSEGLASVIAVRSETVPAGVHRWEDVVDAANAPSGLPPAEIDPDDDATIFYTSGTTGRPKGAQLTHRGSTHNIMHLLFWTFCTAMARASDPDAAPPVEAEGPALQTCFMAPTPLFHVTACNCVLHPATVAGGRVVLMHRWDVGRALELIEREKVTNFSGVPSMSRELLNHPDWHTRDVSTLTGLGGGGAALQPDLVDKIARSVPQGAPVTGYGMTETSGIITANAAEYYTSKPASCGPVMPTFEYKLVNELGDDLPPDPEAVGELCVRGAPVIKGYLNQPEATASAIRNGWFHTGDLARIDEDGFVFLVDRAKDMVLRGGENIYSAEVEAAIHEHDDVLEAAVFGLPEERLGEQVAAAIVLREGSTLTQDGLQAFVGERLAKYKVPTAIWFRDEPLPRNANGKFLKQQLKDELIRRGV